MLKQFCPCLRNDLIITVKINSQNKTKIYSIQKPDSSENFEFGEEEFFLCQSLDGRSTSDEIIDNFKEEFNVSISADDFENFITQIKQFGLLDNFLSQEERQLANNHHLAEQDDEDDDDFISQSQNNYVPRWSILKNPEPIFESIVSILKPLLILYKLVLWGLIPLFLICLNLWINEKILVQKSLQTGQQLGSFLTFFLISLLLINLVTKVGRGIFATYYGASVKELGMLIRWGFVPRFYTKIIGINQLSKKQQLLIYSSPLFFRGTLFILGTFLWYFNLGQGNLLSSIAILLAIIGLASLISGALPLRPASPGARILALSMNKSANYPRQLMKSSLISLFNSKNNPKRISKKEILIICLGLIITIILCFIVLKISLRFAWGLSLSFPAIFGQGTFYIILSLLLLLGFNYIRKIFIHASDSAPSLLKRETLSNNFDSSYDVDFSLQKKNNGRNLMIILLILIILMIPIPYSIGGDCQLLPPKQQEIQAPVSGKIERIFYRGGDGILITKGAVIADMVSGDLQNKILTLTEQIKEQEAEKEQSQVNLRKLEEGSRQEEIEIRQKQVEVAQQEVKVALSQVEVAKQQVEEIKAELRVEQEKLTALEKQLQTSIVNSQYSQAEISRLEPLYKQGAFSLQRLEDSKKRAETDQIDIAEKRQNLKTQAKIIQQFEAKLIGKLKFLEQVRQSSLTKQKSLQEAQAQLDLILSGTIPAEIEVAKQQVQRTIAELNRLRQELKYTQEQDLSSTLVMPFDGYLVESYLDKKIGSYLNQGEIFATAQDATNLLGALEIPEYDAGEIKIDAPAQVKLLAYPSQPILGKVVAIEPTTKEEDLSLVRVLSVQIQLEPSNTNLKPGMSGYGKIPQGKKPMLVVLTRPLIRFVQIEFWSWLP